MAMLLMLTRTRYFGQLVKDVLFCFTMKKDHFAQVCCEAALREKLHLEAENLFLVLVFESEFLGKKILSLVFRLAFSEQKADQDHHIFKTRAQILELNETRIPQNSFSHTFPSLRTVSLTFLYLLCCIYYCKLGKLRVKELVCWDFPVAQAVSNHLQAKANHLVHRLFLGMFWKLAQTKGRAH